MVHKTIHVAKPCMWAVSDTSWKHLLQIQTWRHWTFTIIREYSGSHTSMYRPPAICQSLVALVACHLFYSRFQAHSHWMIWSQPFYGPYFRDFNERKQEIILYKHCWEKQTNQSKDWDKSQTAFCSNVQCGAKLWIGICIYPKIIESVHLVHVRH